MRSPNKRGCSIQFMCDYTSTVVFLAYAGLLQCRKPLKCSPTGAVPMTNNILSVPRMRGVAPVKGSRYAFPECTGIVRQVLYLEGFSTPLNTIPLTPAKVVLQ